MNHRSIKLLPMIFLFLIVASSVVCAKDGISNGEYLAVALNGFASEKEVRKWAESSSWGGWGVEEVVPDILAVTLSQTSGRESSEVFLFTKVASTYRPQLFIPLRFSQSRVRKDGEFIVVEFRERKIYREFLRVRIDELLKSN